MSCIASYGYRKNRENPKEWLIDEESTEIVWEIFVCVWTSMDREESQIFWKKEECCVLLPIHLVKDMYEYQLKNVQFWLHKNVHF